MTYPKPIWIRNLWIIEHTSLCNKTNYAFHRPTSIHICNNLFQIYQLEWQAHSCAAGHYPAQFNCCYQRSIYTMIPNLTYNNQQSLLTFSVLLYLRDKDWSPLSVGWLPKQPMGLSFETRAGIVLILNPMHLSFKLLFNLIFHWWRRPPIFIHRP